MNAKEYLNQIAELATKIDGKLSMIDRGEKYNVFPNSKSCEEWQNELQKDIDEYLALSYRIVDEIHSLQCGSRTKTYIAILHNRYVLGQKLTEIAEELNYDYKWLCRLHGFALFAFENQILIRKEQDQTRQ